MGMTEFIEISNDLKTKKQMDLQVVNIGYEACPPGYGYGPTFREYELLHFIYGGKGKYTIDGVDFAMETGDAFFIPSRKITYYEADSKDPWSYAWIGFLGTQAAHYVKRLMHAAPKRFVLHGLNTAEYLQMIKKGAALSGIGISNYFAANAVLYEVFSKLAVDLGESEATEQTLADDIKFYLDVKYTENLRMEDVAEVFHIHPNHLTRVFRERFDIPPKQYLLQKKLYQAKKLLKETDMSVGLIASALGFEDSLYFSKLFRKQIGVSPRAFRETA